MLRLLGLSANQTGSINASQFTHKQLSLSLSFSLPPSFPLSPRGAVRTMQVISLKRRGPHETARIRGRFTLKGAGFVTGSHAQGTGVSKEMALPALKTRLCPHCGAAIEKNGGLPPPRP